MTNTLFNMVQVLKPLKKTPIYSFSLIKKFWNLTSKRSASIRMVVTGRNYWINAASDLDAWLDDLWSVIYNRWESDLDSSWMSVNVQEHVDISS